MQKTCVHCMYSLIHDMLVVIGLQDKIDRYNGREIYTYTCTYIRVKQRREEEETVVYSRSFLHASTCMGNSETINSCKVTLNYDFKLVIISPII